ncbi:SDR family NAD(P)-dependent oxidoreductase [Thermodesulfobacteriota bacterium]
MNTLKNKVALVTGASSKKGMGRSIALRLAGEGASVVVSDKFGIPPSIWPEDEGWGGLDAVVDEIKALGGDALPMLADVSNSGEVDNLVAKAIERFGRIDILVNCVGIRGPVPVPVVELDEKDWRMLMDINLTGSFLIAKAVAKTMIPDGEGKKIILISSQVGTKGYPGAAAYCASKHGVLGLAKTLALELARSKINVNAICPGAIDTSFRDESMAAQAKAEGISIKEVIEKDAKRGPAAMIPLGRLGTSEDVADLALFLVSEQSRYITGEMFTIAGGLT